MKIMVSAYLDNNIGDDLMIKILAGLFPKDVFFLYSNKSVIKNTFKDTNNIIVKDLEHRKTDVQDIDMFLSIGGSLFNDLNSYKGQIMRFKRILFLKKLKKNKKIIATIGCNLGPYDNKIGPYLTKIELKMNDLVTVRDNDSLEMLNSFKGLKKYYIADDIVYNLDVEKYSSEKNIGLGISVYRSLKEEEYNYSNYVALANIADEFINKTGKPVRLFAFDSESENDLSAAHHITNLANRKESIEIIPYLGDSNSFIKKMNECEKFIAIRFHSAVISDILNIPFLPVVYSNKMSSLLKDKGYKGRLIDIEKLNNADLDIELIVEEIISSNNLFKSNKNLKNNALIHFNSLSEVLKKEKIKS